MATPLLLAQICWGESHFSQKWPLASVGKYGESAQHSLANVGESGESQHQHKTPRRHIREYSQHSQNLHLQNSLLSGHCLVLINIKFNAFLLLLASVWSITHIQFLVKNNWKNNVFLLLLCAYFWGNDSFLKIYYTADAS